MKLPSIETGPVQQLNPGTTPGQEVQVQQAKTKALTTAGTATAEVYKGVSAVALSNAQTTTKKEYAQQWGDFAAQETVSTQQLDDLGVEYDPNLAYITSAGPEGGEVQGSDKVIPTWAVAPQYHAKLVQNLRDKNTPTATEAARSRYQTEFDIDYAVERQTKVDLWANEQRLNYQRTELERNVGDLLELGDYAGAMQTAAMGKASGVLTDEMYAAISDGVMEVKERSGYVEVIEAGTMREKADLLEELLEGIQEDSRVYNGELTVEERQKYINQLQTSLNAASGSTDKSIVAQYLKELKATVDRGDQWGREMQMTASAVVGNLGNEGQQHQFNTLMAQMHQGEAIFSADIGTEEAYMDQLRKQADTGDLAAQSKLRIAQQQQDSKRQQIAEDPVRYMREHGPATDAKKAAVAAGPFTPTDLFTKDINEVRAQLATRQVAMNEAAGLFGADELLLTKGEAAQLSNAFAFGTMDEQLQIAAQLAQLDPDQSAAIFDQLSADGTVKGYALPAAGAAFAAGSVEAANLIIRSANLSDDPIQRTIAADKELRAELNALLGPGLEMSLGTAGRKNFSTAVLNLYAYQMGLNGGDPSSIDTELLQASVEMLSGGTVSDVGRTRVRPPAGLDIDQFNRVLRTGTDEFWQGKIDEADMRFTHGMAQMVNGTGLGQQIRDGRAWLVDAKDGAGGYYVMTMQSLSGEVLQTPQLISDTTGELMTLHFDPDDYVAPERRTRSNAGGR